MRVLSFVGARPHEPKAWVLHRALRNRTGSVKIDHLIFHLGQHSDRMDTTLFEDRLIRRKIYKLPYIAEQDRVIRFSKLLVLTRKICQALGPDIVLVYGDTDTSAAAALASRLYGKAVVAAIESGIRSYDLSQPEELNRYICDAFANVRFCPNRRKLDFLTGSICGITAGREAYVVGDLLRDAINKVPKRLASHILPGKSYLVLTCHRPENTSKERLKNVYHLTERTRCMLEADKVCYIRHPRTPSVRIPFPAWETFDATIPYPDMISLIRNATAVVTDSGGLQREAVYLERPCLIIRNNFTEWPELLAWPGARLISIERFSKADCMKIIANWVSIVKAGALPKIDTYQNIPKAGASSLICERLLDIRQGGNDHACANQEMRKM